MFRKILLLACLLSVFIAVSAQSSKSQTTLRMLKTATTLVEAQQFEAAEEYYKKGLTNARADYDAYNQAVAYEGLGNLYTKTDQPEKAITNYTSAVRIYRLLKYNVLADVAESLLKSVKGIGDLYAGIEIGAKGIKLTVVDVKLSKDREFDYTLLTDTSINTDAAALSYQSEKETADAIDILWNILKSRHQIPSSKVHIVMSSGLMQELDKYKKVEYFANVIRPVSLDPSIKITYITPEQEAQLSLLGIVPQKRRFTATQIDVGSGNTKGGYFDANKKFVPVTFPLGTKSFQRLIESKTAGDLSEYVKTADAIWRDSLRNTVINEFVVKQDVRNRDIMYISGGIVWAIASLMRPESCNNNYTELTAQEISEFRRMLFTDYDKLIKPDLSFIKVPEQERACQKNINRVLKTYDRKALLAGAIWFDDLVQEINTVNPSKKLIYARYAYVGWISGYIIEKATQQYMGLVSN